MLLAIGLVLVANGILVASYGFRREAAGVPDEDNHGISIGLFLIVCGAAVLLYMAMSIYGFPDVPLPIN